MKKALIRFLIVAWIALLVYSSGAVYAEILYEQNYDDLSTLGAEPGFLPQPSLERQPTVFALDNYALDRSSSSPKFFPAQNQPFTIRFFLLATVEAAPDDLGPSFIVRGIIEDLEQPFVQMQWGRISNGQPAYYDGFEWINVGDENLDGEENEGEVWPEPLPISDPAQPDSAQWIPVQLVLTPEDGLYEYWQGEANDFEFDTLERYASELFSPDFPPFVTNYAFGSSEPGEYFLDNVEVLNQEGNSVFLEDYEGVPEREDEAIAVGNQSMVLLKDIDPGFADFPNINETFTVRFLMAVEVQGGEKNQRAAQLQAQAEGAGGIAGFVNWGEVSPGLAAYFDGSAWRAVGDENLNGEQDNGESWPPVLQATNPNDPSTVQWYPIQIVYHFDPEGGVFKTLDYYQGEPNDLEFDTLEQYGVDLIFWHFVPYINRFKYQNNERGGGTVFIDNFSLTTESGSYSFEEDFEGDWERFQPAHSGGVLDSDIAVGSQSVRLRNGTDDFAISFPAVSEKLIVDFMLAMTAEGGNDERGSQIRLSNTAVGGTGGWAPFVCWGQVQPRLANYYDSSQWNIIGDVNKSTEQDGGETWAPETPITDPSTGVENWIPVRLEIDVTNHSYNFYQGDPGDDSFESLIQYGTDLEYWYNMDQLDLLTFMTTNGRVGGDFFVDNVKIYTPETSVSNWNLF